MTTTPQQEEASRVAGQYDTLRDRVVSGEYSGRLSADEVADLRAEMDILSSKYLDLTGEVLK